jgi:putative nucleotidyltransferase with HDIG domain
MNAPPASLDSYLEHIQNLPPTPTVLVKLIEKFRQSEVDADETVQLLRRDPSLAAEVLRRCNDSFIGDDNAVMDVHEAVFHLGFHEVYEIAVSLLGAQTLAVSKLVPGFPAEELRVHSSLAALAAGALAREVGVSEGVAFTTALLHDVGKLALALAEQAKYVTLMEHCKRAGTSLSAAERESFGFDHSQIGAQLLRRWGLPEEMVWPVQVHSEAGRAAEVQDLVVVTRAASEMANHIQVERPGAFSEHSAAKPLMEHFRLAKEQVDGWEQLVRNRLKQLPRLEKR